MVKKLKMMIDIVMMILFMMMMGYHIFGEAIHEWMGMVLFMFFSIHQILNRKWFLGLVKGHYSYQRYLFLLINVLLMIVFVITMISGILISKNIFMFIEIENTMLVRKLHMFSSIWTYLLMSIHLGLHVTFIKNKMFENKILRKISKFIYICLFLYGGFIFTQRKLFNDMFLLNDFKFLLYGESIFHFTIAYVAIMTVGAVVGYVVLHKEKYFNLLQEKLRWKR